MCIRNEVNNFFKDPYFSYHQVIHSYPKVHSITYTVEPWKGAEKLAGKLGGCINMNNVVVFSASTFITN